MTYRQYVEFKLFFVKKMKSTINRSKTEFVNSILLYYDNSLGKCAFIRKWKFKNGLSQMLGKTIIVNCHLKID